MRSVWISWGTPGECRHYDFDTEEQLNQFLAGVEEAAEQLVGDADFQQYDSREEAEEAGCAVA